MKKIFPVSFFLFLIVISLNCAKTGDSCIPKTPQSEQADMVAFASANGMTPTLHSSGVYYEITNPGSGTAPSVSSKVYVKYTGKLMNGTVFDSQSDASKTGWLLGNLIAGWRVGLPLIQKGGSIKLIIPSSLGYGCVQVNTIPPSSILYFEVELVDVQ